LIKKFQNFSKFFKIFQIFLIFETYDNRKSSSLGSCYFNDGLIPVARAVGTSVLEDVVLFSTLSGELNAVGAEDLEGFSVGAGGTVLDSDGVLAVVRDLLN
jgi:hypothetical protein